MPTLSSYSFLSSLSAGHGRHQSNHHPRTEVKDSDQVGSYLFYVNGKFLLFLHWTIAAYLGSKFLQLDYDRLFWNHMLSHSAGHTAYLSIANLHLPVCSIPPQPYPPEW
jgi:hypothetical protein